MVAINMLDRLRAGRVVVKQRHRGEPTHRFCFCTKNYVTQNTLVCAAGCTGAPVLPISQLLTLALWCFIHMGLSVAEASPRINFVSVRSSI